MKKFILILMALSLTSCAYNQIKISANNGATVNCSGNVDKPVTLDRIGQGNTVPVSAVP